jgi:hypothetical protein
MLRELKRLQVLLALVISLSVPVFSGYLLYCDIADNNLFSPDANYENADVDDLFLSPDCQHQLKFFGSVGPTALVPVFPPEANAIEQVPLFSSLSSCLVQENLVLRC